MGAACCIAAKSKTTGNGSSGASSNVQIHSRYSPSWSFRWDNRGRVAGEDTSVDWLDNRVRENDRATLKSSAGATFASDDGSLLDSFRSAAWQKSPPPQGNDKTSIPPSSGGPGVSRIPEQVKDTSPRKLSPSVPSVSSMSPASPLSFHGHLLLPANATPSRWLHCSPAPEFSSRVSSDSRIPEYKSLTFSISEEPSLFPSPAWANESTGGGSLDSWSIPEFSDLAISARRERWSFDSGTSSFSREKISGRKSSGAASFDLQTCGICAKLLRERSSSRWAGQKAAISSSEIAVVSVLTCGHVYHGECLEYLTPEINKYDPSCPVCTFGEKTTLKMWEKALTESKAKRRSRRRVVDGDPKGSSGADMMMFFDPLKGNGSAVKQGSTRGGNNNNNKPFLKRHFSFVSRSAAKSVSENQSTPRKALFWAKSTKY